MPAAENGKKNAPKDLSIFEPLDFFMMRAPLMSVGFFEELFDSKKTNPDNVTKIKDDIVALSQKDFFRDAISTTSPSLQYALDKFDSETDPGKKNITAHSFIKYLIRMSTRPTPFGLFSGVSAGKLDGNTEIGIKALDCQTKRARPDMEWLMGVINTLEKRVKVVEQLKVRANTSVLLSGNRLEIPYLTHYGQQGLESKTESISIRATKPVIYILEQAKSFIQYADLLKRLIAQYPETPEDKVRGVLWQLFENEFLISELRPPLLLQSPFEYVFERISGIEGIADELAQIREIRDLIGQYNKMKPGEGVALFATLSDILDKVYKVNHSTQIDLKLGATGLKLNRSVANELAKAADCLWRLSPEYTSSPELKQYRLEFIEKYGFYREIPVLELLDNDRGLGAPPNYYLPKGRIALQENQIPLSIRKFEYFILNELPVAIRDKKSEIEITEEILEKLEPVKPDPSVAPLTCELYFSIGASSQEAVDKGEFEIILGPNVYSLGAGKTFGRFMDLLEPELRQEIRRIDVMEKEKLIIHGDTQSVFAEIVYLPERGRNANVVITENIRDYEVAIGTNSSKSADKTLPLSDLMVGATENYLYLKSRSLNKRVIITTGHMLNTVGVPNVCKFLREVSTDGRRDLTSINFGSFAFAPFLPRIRYGKVILSPAKWSLSIDTLRTNKDGLKDNFRSLIKQWREEWNVPRFVYMTEFDNRILLDLEYPLHLEILQDELLHKKKEENNFIEIVEMGNDFGSRLWVKGESGAYFTEFVLPFIRKNGTVLEIAPENQEKNNIAPSNVPVVLRGAIPDKDRIRFPGSDWLYLKLYGNSNREDEFIAFELNMLYKKVASDNLAAGFFFIRYKDREPHTRLRFRGEPEQLSTRLLPYLNEWFLYLAEIGLLSKVAVDTYERETERYGGPELIESAEELFYHDSLAAINILFLKRAGLLKMNFDVLAVISILDLLEALGLTFDEQLDWLNTMVSSKDYLDDFRQSRRILMEIGESSNNWEALRNYVNGKEIFDILASRKKAVIDYAVKLKAVEAKNELWNTKSDIIGSIIHLHCNRLLGVNREHEKKVMALARHTQNSLRLYKKEQDKKDSF